MSRGRRFDSGNVEKLNLKKVVAILIAIIVIIMIVLIIKNLLVKGKDDGKISSTSYFTCFENDKWGVIDSKGESVINPSYQELIIIPNNKKDVFLCTYDVDYNTNSYKTKALNSKNEEIFTQYDQIEAISNNDENQNIWYDDNAIRVEKNEKYGLINLDGKEIAPTEYDEITVVEGIKNAIKVNKYGKYGVLDSEGKQILDTKYLEITAFGKDNKEGYIVKTEDGKYGIVDYLDQTVIEAKYDSIEKVHGSNLYVVTEGGEKKVINKDGESVVTTGFNNIKSISEMDTENAGIIFEKDGKYGLMDLEGNVKLDAQYDDLTEAKPGIYIAKQGDICGIIDSEKTEIVPFENNTITYNKEADIYIIEDEQYNAKILNNNYEEKISGILLDIDTEKDYIKMRVGDEYKYYNFEFEEKPASTFLTLNTLFLSKQDGKYGYVDEKGKVVVDYQYDDATEQNAQGYSAVKKDGKWGSIDSKGNLVVETIYNLDEYLQVDFIGKWHKGIDLNMNYYCQE